MNFKEIRLDFKYCEKGRFYRTLLVKPDTNLVDLGCIILTAFGAAFEHNFYFVANNKNYNPRVFMEDPFEDDVLMNDYNLLDLGEKFDFCYDTGEGYNFTAEVTDSNILCDEENYGNEAKLIDGKGQGIWEDNIHTLYGYLEGHLDHPIREADEEEGYYKPWNFDIEEYSDFDNAFDLEFEKERFELEYLLDIVAYKDQEASYFGNQMENEFIPEDDEYIDEQQELFSSLYDMTMKIVNIHIKEIDFVIETYNRLLLNHKPKEAKEMIAKEFMFEHFHAAKKKRAFKEKNYINALKKLV